MRTIHWTARLIVAAFTVFSGCGDNDGHQVVQTVSRYGRTPIAGVKVQVGDQAWATTDANGEAIFDGMGKPFSVRVHQTTELEEEGYRERYDDVWELVDQTANPVVVGVLSTAATSLHATISGRVTGQTGAAGARVLVFARTGPSSSTTTLAAPDGSYELPFVAWEGDPTKRVDVGAIELDSAAPPRRYAGYGATSVTLTAIEHGGPSSTSVDLALQPVATGRISGTVALPPDFTADLHPELALEFRDGSSVPLHGRTTIGSGTFDFAFPLLEGTHARLGFTADSLGAQTPLGSTYHYRRVVAPASGLEVVLPPVAKQLEPAAGGSFDGATRFRWGAVPGLGIYALGVVCSAPRATSRHEVHFHLIETTKTEAHLPTIPGLELGDSQCSWQAAWLDAAAATSLSTGLAGDRYEYSFSPSQAVVPAP